MDERSLNATNVVIACGVEGRADKEGTSMAAPSMM
jgi:hypothetical protein